MESKNNFIVVEITNGCVSNVITNVKECKVIIRDYDSQSPTHKFRDADGETHYFDEFIIDPLIEKNYHGSETINRED